MAKKLLIITLLLATSFSLMAQWTCETIDPEFDNATKVAYNNTDNNKAQLMMSDYLPTATYDLFWSYYRFYIRYPVNYLKPVTFQQLEPETLQQFEEYLSKTGNIPLVLVGYFNYLCPKEEFCSVYSFEVSFKVGDTYKKYKYFDKNIDTIHFNYDFLIAYEYGEKTKVGRYRIEWPSKEFWKDFKVASSVKIRIKNNVDSDYQYYEFNMNGSTKAFNYVTANHQIIWPEDGIEGFIKK